MSQMSSDAAAATTVTTASRTRCQGRGNSSSAVPRRCTMILATATTTRSRTTKPTASMLVTLNNTAAVPSGTSHQPDIPRWRYLMVTQSMSAPKKKDGASVFT